MSAIILPFTRGPFDVESSVSAMVRLVGARPIPWLVAWRLLRSTGDAREIANRLRSQCRSSAMGEHMASAEEIAERLNARREGPHRWKAKCPAHDDSDPSLSIGEARTGGRWFTVLPDASRTTVIAALQAKGLWNGHEGTSTMRGAFAKNLDSPAIILPIPDNAPFPPIEHPTLGLPVETWNYFDASGHQSFQVWRLNPRRKEDDTAAILLGNGWQWRALPEPRPLYGLDKLTANPSAPVVVVEGENAADAASRIFPNSICVTSPGGSAAAAKCDWTPLAKRQVLVWPDADEPGADYQTNGDDNPAGSRLRDFRGGV